jgi:membrane-bound serine protease (ClpP class)
MGFLQGTAFGIGMLVVAIFGVPTVIVLGFRYWPRTAMGRRVILAAPRPEDVAPAEEHRRYLRSLVGKVGRAKCKMLPGGAVTIDGRTIEALSEGPAIEAGEPVRVIQVRGMRLVVRRLEDEPPAESAPDPLRRPIETIAQDPFAEPPTEGQQT